jgi:hypothetical protein
MSSTATWAFACSAIIAADLLLFWIGYRLSTRTGQSTVSLNRKQLSSDFDVLRSAMEGLDDCLATVDHAMQRVAPMMPKHGSENDDGRIYSIAHKLAGKGASVEALMADCGLSRGEAQVVHNLHNNPI